MSTFGNFESDVGKAVGIVSKDVGIVALVICSFLAVVFFILAFIPFKDPTCQDSEPCEKKPFYWLLIPSFIFLIIGLIWFFAGKATKQISESSRAGSQFVAATTEAGLLSNLLSSN